MLGIVDGDIETGCAATDVVKPNAVPAIKPMDLLFIVLSELLSNVMYDLCSGGDFHAVFQHSIFELNPGDQFCQTLRSF